MIAQQVGITTSDTKIVAGFDGSVNAPKGVVILNPSGSGQTVYVGGEGVDATDGFPIAEGGVFTCELVAGESLWAIAGGACNVQIIANGASLT